MHKEYWKYRDVYLEINKELLRTRHVIQFRATATLRRLQIKQYTASKEGVQMYIYYRQKQNTE